MAILMVDFDLIVRRICCFERGCWVVCRNRIEILRGIVVLRGGNLCLCLFLDWCWSFVRSFLRLGWMIFLKILFLEMGLCCEERLWVCHRNRLDFLGLSLINCRELGLKRGNIYWKMGWLCKFIRKFEGILGFFFNLPEIFWVLLSYSMFVWCI